MPEPINEMPGLTEAAPFSSSVAAPAPGVGTRVMRNASAMLAGRGLSLLLAGLASVVLARYLGAEKLGEFTAVYAYLTLFAWLSGSAMAPVVVREISQNRDQRGSIIQTGVWVASAFACGTFVVAVAVAPFAHFGGSLWPLVAIGSLEIFLLSPVILPGAIFQAELRQWYSSGSNLIRQVLWLGIVLWLFRLGAPLIYVVAGRLAAAAVEAILTWKFSRQFLAPPRQFLKPVAARLVRRGSILAVSALAASVYMRIDQVMLHWMSSDHVVGEYAVGVRLSELFEALPAAFISSLFPLLCAHTLDRERFDRYLAIGYRYMVLAAATISMVICVGAKPLVILLYGNNFSAAAKPLSILIWSEIAVFFGSVLTNALLAKGREGYIIVAATAGALANVMLNLYCIPRWHATGASWATVIAYGVSWFLALIPFGSVRDLLWPGLRTSAPIIATAVAISIGASYLAIGTWMRLLIALTVFAAAGALLGFAKPADFRILKDSLKGFLGQGGGSISPEPGVR
jgi:O-antigen/teichoic acid export membrane protein